MNTTLARYRGYLATGVVLLGASVCGLTAHAQILAGFTDGNGTATYDQYVGTTGSGWLSAWSTRTNQSSVAFGNTVVNTTPLNGQGNYLAVSATNNFSAAASAFTDRTFDGTGATGNPNGVNVSQPVRYSWLFSTPSTTPQFLFVNQIGSTPSGTGGTNTWVVLSNGGFWAVQNTVGGTTATSNSTIAVRSNDVYSFSVTTAPATYNYSVVITDLTTSATYTSPLVSFRDQAGQSDGTNLGFGMNLAAGATGSFSLDSVSISQVPEPAAGNLLGLTMVVGGGFFVVRRRLVKA